MSVFGPTQREEEARVAEERGDYGRAAALYASAGRLEEAARVTMLRGDAEARLPARIRHYTRAASLAPEGSPVHHRALTQRAATRVSLAAASPGNSVARRELLEAARELEALGEHQLAADAYARADDITRQARALERAGDVDGVERLLGAVNDRARIERARRNDEEELALLVATGRRREAVTLAGASLDGRVSEIEPLRAVGGVVRAVVTGERRTIVLGERVVLGRAPGATHEGAPITGIGVASAALSRSHLMVSRRGDDVVVRDLGSRHGTQWRGVGLAAELVVGAGIEIMLARAVPVTLSPADEIPGAIAIEVGTSRYVAALGPALLGVGRWRLELASDRWAELVTDDAPPAFLGAVRWEARSTLLYGDAVAPARDGAPALLIER